MGRAPCCEKVGLKKGRWTAEEDDLLRKYILQNGEGNWRSLPKNAGLLRCGKSCRLRWINYLRDDLKRGNISSAEEEVIINLHSSLGNRWSVIASQLPGRTDNEIKNYWNSHLSRKIHSYRRPAANTHLAAAEIAQAAAVPKRRGGRNARWAMKKNRSNFTVNNRRNGVTSVGKTKETIAINEVVPLPSTPELDKEVLSTTTVEDWMVLEPSAFHDVTEEAENLITNSMLRREVGVEKVTDEISGPHNSDMFCFYDVSENKPSEQNEVRVISPNPDKENKVVPFEAVKSNSSSSNSNLKGEEKSCEVDWDWESVVRREDVWEDQNQSMLSWLLDDDNNVDIDSQQDIVSWLLS